MPSPTPLLLQPQTHTTKPCRCTHLQVNNPSCPQPVQTETAPSRAELCVGSIRSPGSSRDPAARWSARFLPCACAVQGRTCSHGRCAHPPRHRASPPASRGPGCCREDTRGPGHPIETKGGKLGTHSWATSSAMQPSLSLSGSACCGFHSMTSTQAQSTGSGKGKQHGWETPKPFHPVAEGGLEVRSNDTDPSFQRHLRTQHTSQGDCPSDQRSHELL